MRLVTYRTGFGARCAGVRGERLVDLNRTDVGLPTSLRELLSVAGAPLAQGASSGVWQRVAEAIARGEAFGPEDVELLAPIPDPQKVICVGLNYADHARESGVEPPPEPVIFNKFPTTIAAPGETIVLPAASEAVDYEAELVVVIGRAGKNIPQASALEYVAGYCCGNDISARDWQLHKPGKQWLLGKSFDGFAPLGPHLVTADEIANPGKLSICFRLNGQTLQESNTDQLIFSIPRLIEYVSQVCTLLPGDVIFTGTPAGVGFARKPPLYLKPGDLCEVEIEGVGLLRNRVER